MLPNVGGPEILVILIVALLVLGPDKLPNAARQVGKAMGEIRRLGAGFQAEMRDAMNQPDPAPEPEPPAPATSPPPARRRRARPLEAAPAELHEDDPAD